MNKRVIPIVAPRAPKCFTSRDQWVLYLQSAQSHPKPERRPFVGEKYRPTFSFCRDCDAARRDEMTLENRCEHDAYVARVLADMEEAIAAAA